jgi:alkylhydroperoxidase family enzyme
MDVAARACLDEVPGAFEVIAEHFAVGATGADPEILMLCRARMLTLMGAATPEGAGEKLAALSSWPTSPLFTDFERAALAFAEMFIIDVSSIDDELVAALRRHLTPAEVYRFVTAIWVTDQENRVDAALTRVRTAREALS